MATTEPRVWVGTPIVNSEIVETIYEWYRSALADSDKADDIEAHLEYTVTHEVCASVLDLLYGGKPA